MAFTELWNDVDFQLNRHFWNQWGLDASLPFRIMNLKDLSSLSNHHGFNIWLIGRSAQNVHYFGELRQDHDDDLAIDVDLTEWLADLHADLEDAGFKLIRQGQILSLARHGRYVDIHSSPSEATKNVNVHGYELSVGTQVRTEDNRQTGANLPIRKLQLRTRSFARRGLEKFRNDPGGAIKSATKISFDAMHGVASTLRRPPRRLSETEFLSLFLDSPSAINWSWRERQLEGITRSGESLAESLQKIDLQEIYRGKADADTAQPFNEPLSLNRDFWKSGNALYRNPLLHGFRHLVMPYTASNLYINAGLLPALYTDEYYASLPQMTEAEIERFLCRRPISVRGGAIDSGRHRAVTMIGRLARGEPYVPLYCH